MLTQLCGAQGNVKLQAVDRTAHEVPTQRAEVTHRSKSCTVAEVLYALRPSVPLQTKTDNEFDGGGGEESGQVSMKALRMGSKDQIFSIKGRKRPQGA